MTRLLGAFVACASLLYVGDVCAQEAPAQSGETPGLEEVIVTAEKVSEDIEKAPLAITAITGAEIQWLHDCDTWHLHQCSGVDRYPGSLV
jgi:iron complex outermembrane receptor protein